jgi:hypothetical protein
VGGHASLLSVNQGCKVYGISAWDLDLTGACQSDLIITQGDEPVLTVDGLEVAQFIYLLLDNAKIRDAIVYGQKTYAAWR